MRVFFQASRVLLRRLGPPHRVRPGPPALRVRNPERLAVGREDEGARIPAARDEALRPRRTEVAPHVDDRHRVVVGVRDVERPAVRRRARARSESSRPGARPPKAYRGRRVRARPRSAARPSATATSTAATRFRFDCATKSVRPSRAKTRSDGWSAVFTVPTTAPDPASTRETVAAPQFATARSVPSGERTGRYGWTPTGDPGDDRARREVDPDEVVQEDARGPEALPVGGARRGPRASRPPLAASAERRSGERLFRHEAVGLEAEDEDVLAAGAGEVRVRAVGRDREAEPGLLHGLLRELLSRRRVQEVQRLVVGARAGDDDARAVGRQGERRTDRARPRSASRSASGAGRSAGASRPSGACPARSGPRPGRRPEGEE